MSAIVGVVATHLPHDPELMRKDLLAWPEYRTST